MHVVLLKKNPPCRDSRAQFSQIGRRLIAGNEVDPMLKLAEALGATSISYIICVETLSLRHRTLPPNFRQSSARHANIMTSAVLRTSLIQFQLAVLLSLVRLSSLLLILVDTHSCHENGNISARGSWWCETILIGDVSASSNQTLNSTSRSISRFSSAQALKQIPENPSIEPVVEEINGCNMTY